ncbi:MAG: hypothetical protein ABJO29_05975 [Yoonia sp.]|uniref:hypothetical protein n=1 Tax=Yoonia sp. TaxID=2212373 RepID=UPI0032679526
MVPSGGAVDLCESVPAPSISRALRYWRFATAAGGVLANWFPIMRKALRYGMLWLIAARLI